MKQYQYALVDGQLQEPHPGLAGTCPTCGGSMVAKCGPERDSHWAHKGDGVCDRWGEPETEWHRAWKGQFPGKWREVPHHDAATGELHRADVKTDRGWVIEVQHSYIEPAERQARNDFYKKLIWVIDATKKRATAQLLRAWEDGRVLGSGKGLRKVLLDDCALLQRWGGGAVRVFFDIGETHDLLWLIASSTSGWAYLGAFPRAQFMECLRGDADEVFEHVPNQIRHNESLESLVKSVPVRPMHDPLAPRRRPRPPL